MKSFRGLDAAHDQTDVVYGDIEAQGEQDENTISGKKKRNGSWSSAITIVSLGIADPVTQPQVDRDLNELSEEEKDHTDNSLGV